MTIPPANFVHYVPSIDPEYFWICVVGGIVAWVAAWGIGANDTANAWGTTIGAKAISVRNAAILAGTFEVVGAFALGANVGGTLKSKIVPPQEYCYDNYSLVTRMIGMASSDLGSGIWLLLATYFGMPVSTTHAAVGGITGFGIVSRGWDAVIWWETLGKIFISWVTSPLLSALIGFILQWIVLRFLFTGKPGSIFRKNQLFLPAIGGLFIGVAAVFAFYIGGKSNDDIKELPGWMFATVFAAVSVGMIAILYTVSWFLRKRWNIDLHAYDDFHAIDDVERRRIEDQPLDDNDAMWAEDTVETPLNPLATTPAGTPVPQPAVPEKPEKKDMDSATFESADAPKTKATFFNGGEMQTKDIYDGKTEEFVAANQLWVPLCWVVAATESFAHGANDVGNAIGPYAALIDSYNKACPKGTSTIPYWIMGLGASGILVGLLTYGHHVIRTLGVNISIMVPQKACVSEMATVLSVLIATALAIPVSTTHCAVGALTGVSLVHGVKNVNWKTIWGVILCIVITMPACALMTAAMFGFWMAAVFGPSYPGPYMFNKYCNATKPGPWNTSGLVK